jgi:hypothetical protein
VASKAQREELRIGCVLHYLAGDLMLVLGTVRALAWSTVSSCVVGLLRGETRHARYSYCGEASASAWRGAACSFLTVPWRVRAIDGAGRALFYSILNIELRIHAGLLPRPLALRVAQTSLPRFSSWHRVHWIDRCVLLPRPFCLFLYGCMYLLVHAIPSHILYLSDTPSFFYFFGVADQYYTVFQPSLVSFSPIKYCLI